MAGSIDFTPVPQPFHGRDDLIDLLTLIPTPKTRVRVDFQKCRSGCPLLADSGHSGLGLLRYLEGIIDLDPKVADGALQFAVSEK